MTGVTLEQRAASPVHVDASPLGDSLASLSITEILHLRLPVIASNDSILVKDRFDVQARTDHRVVIQGDLSTYHGIGTRWSGGELVVEGNVGDGFASRMSGGEVHLRGDAGHKTAQQMRGGMLKIEGNVGDDLGCPLHGRRSGFSGGTIHVIGNIGDHAGFRMRRGMLIVQGNCGNLVGCDTVAGTILITGRVGSDLAIGMHRGTVIVPHGTHYSPLRFTPSESHRLSIATVLANDIQTRLPTVAAALRSNIDRSLGDLTCSGRGEIWFY